jgi:hypothetical protein
LWLQACLEAVTTVVQSGKYQATDWAAGFQLQIPKIFFIAEVTSKAAVDSPNLSLSEYEGL